MLMRMFLLCLRFRLRTCLCVYVYKCVYMSNAHAYNFIGFATCVYVYV